MKRLLGAFTALALLTLLTTGFAFINLGPGNLTVSLLIAAMKVAIVALFFMHVGHSRVLVKVFAFGTLFWLAVLIMLSFNDYLSRLWIENPSLWP